MVTKHLGELEEEKAKRKKGAQGVPLLNLPRKSKLLKFVAQAVCLKKDEKNMAKQTFMEAARVALVVITGSVFSAVQRSGHKEFVRVGDEADERAVLHVAIENPGACEKVEFLIDCGSTHSFLSPICMRKLKLNQYPANRLVVELANGKEILSQHTAGQIDFELGGYSTSAQFRTLPLRVYDGILGMDWLKENQAHIHCAQGNFTFTNNLENEVLVQGKNGMPKAHLLKAARLLKGLKKEQQIYAVKLNKVEQSDSKSRLDWLKEYANVYPKDLANLPPYCEVDHEIKTIPGCEPVSKRPYKMSLLEAIELKEQLKQLIKQGLIRPGTSPWGASVLFQKKKDGSFFFRRRRMDPYDYV
ncbi:hypothetical protein L7F22_040839 [Adiantum nelumboides]|nr:hypothetical protein [Adiantum nelumboides]